MGTATAIMPSTVLVIEKSEMFKVLAARTPSQNCSKKDSHTGPQPLSCEATGPL
jgi:hypothetical protein